MADGPVRAITGSQLILDYFVSACQSISRLHNQKARELLVYPQYGTDRILGTYFWIDLRDQTST
jgi:hypothetical protein